MLQMKCFFCEKVFNPQNLIPHKHFHYVSMIYMYLCVKGRTQGSNCYNQYFLCSVRDVRLPLHSKTHPLFMYNVHV